MADLKVIRNLAKKALIISTPMSNRDDSLWDRNKRLIRNVELIYELPELNKAALPTDHFCLITATHFIDTGLANHLRSGKTKAKPATRNTNNQDLLFRSTQIVEETLANAIDKVKINNINSIILESGGDSTQRPEAMILSDARNLDDIGAAGIFNEFKRHVIEGKGVSNALECWKKKIDYRYWQSRLEKSFRFEAVRKLAEQRLSTAEQFMNQLKIENDAHDLKTLTAKPVLV